MRERPLPRSTVLSVSYTHLMNSINHIRGLLIDTGDGRKVPLSQVADITSTAGPNTINRENAQRKIVVSVSYTHLDVYKRQQSSIITAFHP